MCNSLRVLTSFPSNRALLAIALVATMLIASRVDAQTRDPLLNGALIGAAAGAGAGIAFTHAVRDSDLTFSQYARGALIFGAIGAGIGLGVDAALFRRSPGPNHPPRRMSIVPAAWRHLGGVTVRLNW